MTERKKWLAEQPFWNKAILDEEYRFEVIDRSTYPYMTEDELKIMTRAICPPHPELCMITLEAMAGYHFGMTTKRLSMVTWKEMITLCLTRVHAREE